MRHFSKPVPPNYTNQIPQFVLSPMVSQAEGEEQEEKTQFKEGIAKVSLTQRENLVLILSSTLMQ